MSKKIVETPLMKQYLEMKQKHPDAVLLFRVGDFYETFSDDAITTSEILGITLTKRNNGGQSQTVELAGFPHHALDTYLPKLVRAGKKVAICEQLEDPKLTKKLVKRGIIELVTPGVSINENVLDHRQNNFLAAIHVNSASKDKATRNHWGMSLLDISTGEFLVAQGLPDYISKLLANFQPKELLLLSGLKNQVLPQLSAKYNITELDDWIFTYDSAITRLLKHFKTATLKGFGIQEMDAAIVAAGAIMYYLDITQHTQTGHITAINRIEEDRYVRLDSFTVRNLELIEPMTTDGKTLLSVIDHTISPMGARMLRRWLMFPLLNPQEINSRLDVVEYFFRNPDEREQITHLLETVGDLERIVARASVGRITPRETLQILAALKSVQAIKEICSNSTDDSLKEIGDKLNPLAELQERIARDIRPNCTSTIKNGDFVNEGVDAELDELRQIAFSGKDYLLKMQQREIERTGIPSLKVAYNNVFGYYIEVTNTHKDRVPQEWIRKQTLVNAERYITQELKEYEDKILTAQERITIIENRIFSELVQYISSFISQLQTDAFQIARLDCLLSLAQTSLQNKYNRPIVDDSLSLDIIEGRHPVIEKQLPIGEPYITNTVHLDNSQTQIMMITGPNMSGKSALLRQTALNVILAQIGSFVAAESARIGIVDKIFTRVGASDNISLGESTFMVEMTEASSILNNLSQRSLILFDELGRGTSTYDGISIAWAIVEYIHDSPHMHPKTLFATHYHELNEMEKTYPRIVNYNVSVKEIDGKVVFLRKLARGGSEHSFGIHVAKLAGMPPSIVARADRVLKKLEENAVDREQLTQGIHLAQDKRDTTGGYQLTLFQLDDPVLSQIRDLIIGLDINNLTPMAALNKLHDIKTILTGK